MNMSQEVNDCIVALQEPWQVEVCSRLRTLIHEALPEGEERMQYRKPHFLKNGKYAAVITPAKQHIGFTIFNTASLELPADEFDGPPERKTIKLGKNHSVDYAQLTSLLKQASAAL